MAQLPPNPKLDGVHRTSDEGVAVARASATLLDPDIPLRPTRRHTAHVGKLLTSLVSQKNTDVCLEACVGQVGSFAPLSCQARRGHPMASVSVSPARRRFSQPSHGDSERRERGTPIHGTRVGGRKTNSRMRSSGIFPGLVVCVCGGVGSDCSVLSVGRSMGGRIWSPPASFR